MGSGLASSAAAAANWEAGHFPRTKPKSIELLVASRTNSWPNVSHMSHEKRLVELKLQLPPAPKPVAVYKTAVVAGNLAYVSGHGPLKVDKSVITGRVGDDLDLDAGK